MYKHIEPYLREKRQELIWALAKQGYTAAQLSKIFGVDQSTASRIIDAMPKDWRTRWVKK